MTASLRSQATDPRFAAAWEESRRRGRHLLAWWIGGPIVFIAVLMGLGLVLPEETLDRAANTLALPGGLVWMAGSGILTFRLAGLACPRCGEAFYRKGLYGNLFARRCLHCRLPKGAPAAPPPTH